MNSNVADYEVASPVNLASAFSLLCQEPGRWTPIAGGTELMVQLGAGVLSSRRLMSIWNLTELRGIEVTADSIRIGSGSTFTDVRCNVLIAAEFPLLARAASWIGGIANQNRSTLGGNIVNASPAADSPPALLVYDASVELASAGGTRRLPYTQFHSGYKKTALAPDELLIAVHLPRHAPINHQYLRKVGTRNAQAISKVAMAALGHLKDGRLTRVRIACASVAAVPLRCYAAEQVLDAQFVDAHLVMVAKEALAEEIKPIDDIRSNGDYRRRVAQNLLGEFLASVQVSGRLP